MGDDHPNALAYRRTADAFRAQDLAVLASLISRQVVWHVPGSHSMAGEIRGRDQLLDWLGRLAAHGFWLQELDVFGNDRHVCAISLMGARREGVDVSTRGDGYRLHVAPTEREAEGTGAPDAVVDVDGREVTISHPDKVFFSEHGDTKMDLVQHYLRFEDPVLCTMGGRPTLMQRFPEGADGSSFFQKRVPRSAPDWLETTIVSTPNGTTSRALVVADLAHLLWAVNLGCLGFHPWPYRADDPEHTDELRLDLDPQPGTDFSDVRAAAAALHDLLEEVGIRGHPKTTGNRGLHVYVRLEPRWDSYQVRHGAVAIARELERRHPDLITASWWKEERGERVFLDYNQNAPHKTVFGAWCVRPRPGAQVSTPLRWEDVDRVHPDELTIRTLPERIDELGDPWLHMDEEPQSLEPLLAMHERDRAAGLMDAPWPPVYPKQPDEPPRVAPSRAKKQPDTTPGA